MKFSHFENDKGERSNKAILPMYQVFGEEFDDYFFHAEINEEGELSLKFIEDNFENLEEDNYRNVCLSIQEDVKKFIETVDINKLIEEQFEFYNFESEPFACDDIYIIPKLGQVSKLGAIVFGEDNMSNIAKISEVLDGLCGLQIIYPSYGEVPIELPIELSQNLINNIRDITVNPGKNGSPTDGGFRIANDIEFNIDGDDYQVFGNGSVIYNKTLNCMWRWDDKIFDQIKNSEPVKLRKKEIDQSNQDLLDNLGL